jgi:hypothetical protein
MPDAISDGMLWNAPEAPGWALPVGHSASSSTVGDCFQQKALDTLCQVWVLSMGVRQYQCRKAFFGLLMRARKCTMTHSYSQSSHALLKDEMVSAYNFLLCAARCCR